MRRLVVRPEAEADIEEAFHWYESRARGLGTEFIRALDAVLAAIEREPELHAEQYRRARRVLLRRFPYAVYYLIQTESIDVLACLHTRRHPRRWQRRLP